MVSTWNERCLQQNYVHFKDSLAYNGTLLSSELYLTRYIIHTFQQVAADFIIYNCCFSVQLQAASVYRTRQKDDLNWTLLKHSTSNCRILLLMYFISSSDKGNAAKCLAGIRPIPKLCPAHILVYTRKIYTSNNWSQCPDRQHWSATTMAHCIIQSLLINHIWSRAAIVLEKMKIIIASNYLKLDCCSLIGTQILSW